MKINSEKMKKWFENQVEKYQLDLKIFQNDVNYNYNIEQVYNDCKNGVDFLDAIEEI